MYRKRLSVVAALALAGSSLVATTTASAAPPAAPADGHVSDNLSNPLAEEQSQRRQAALEGVIAGKFSEGPVVEVAKGQFVELEREQEESIWTTLAEYPNKSHNTIPEPDRSVDNTTIWEPDFSEEYFEDLLFEENSDDPSMRDFYLELSSGRYTVNGDVTDWVEVPDEAATYGSTDPCGGIVCSNVWNFVDDSVDGWWDAQVADGRSADELNDYLADFDVWDRYDHDGDGDFDEPDGYIDHYQAVHSGQGAETGGGELGTDAIWSHRWYVQLTGIGAGGPTTPDGTQTPYGGTQIGDSDYWIGDYTVEPENGGVGVFAHEYAHDLGLPDLYDTSGNSCPPLDPGCAENSTAFWTLMSSGSYGNDGTIDIGTKPTHMGAWEKLQLGWLDYEVAFAGEKSTHKLGPASATTKKAQALITVLPDKEVVEEIGEPYAGEFYYSGQGNDLDHLMYASFDLPADATLTAQVDYDIEVDYDYAYVVASTDGGDTWDEVETSESTTTDPNGQNFGFGVTGDSGGWVELTADLSAYQGETLVGFRYWTDVAVIERGISVDEISVTGSDVTLGAEEGDPEITADPTNGWTETTGTETAAYANYYIAENRVYRSYDDALRTGPYNFGWPVDRPDWVERFSYQDGLLISYWDTSQSDNNTSSHPGEGLILPIDAHPDEMVRADGGIWRARIQSYDSTFGLEDTEALTLHWFGEESQHSSRPAAPVFDDTNQYYNPAMPQAGVVNPNTGTQIIVKNTSARGNFMQVQVR